MQTQKTATVYSRKQRDKMLAFIEAPLKARHREQWEAGDKEGALETARLMQSLTVEFIKTHPLSFKDDLVFCLVNTVRAGWWILGALGLHLGVWVALMICAWVGEVKALGSTSYLLPWDIVAEDSREALIITCVLGLVIIMPIWKRYGRHVEAKTGWGVPGIDTWEAMMLKALRMVSVVGFVVGATLLGTLVGMAGDARRSR